MLRILATFRRAKQQQQNVPSHVLGKEIPQQEWIQAQKYIKYAEIIYSMESEEEFRPWLQERGFDLIYANFKAVSLMPVHAVAISLQYKEVIVMVRGTYSWDDVVTDMVSNMMKVARPDGYGCYEVHEGMGRAAQELMDRLYPTLAALQEAGFQITITGHSLGAGVGSLMAFFLRDMKGLRDVKAYAYACPACTDYELGERLNEYVVSIVNRDDIVPRLHTQAIWGLVQDLFSVCYEELQESAKVFPPFLGKQMLRKTQFRKGPVVNEDSVKASPGYLPGKVWYEHYICESSEVVRIVVSSVPRDLKDLRIIKLTPVAVTHHSLQHFQAHQLAKNNENELKKKK
eukprot:TRINITY_DN7686_c2_g1_i1.p1 TRINITY_DN7686_c2_g1~~TRINITY_DN7686_c2_g1_i1.p1  ORF type:complete len:344 (+),score=37.69 TRINITY_DN7686_c2_g1_i1:421-1452(+)